MGFNLRIPLYKKAWLVEDSGSFTIFSDKTTSTPTTMYVISSLTTVGEILRNPSLPIITDAFDGFQAFLDEPELQRGEGLKFQIIFVIRESFVHIAISLQIVRNHKGVWTSSYTCSSRRQPFFRSSTMSNLQISDGHWAEKEHTMELWESSKIRIHLTIKPKSSGTATTRIATAPNRLAYLMELIRSLIKTKLHE